MKTKQLKATLKAADYPFLASLITTKNMVNKATFIKQYLYEETTDLKDYNLGNSTDDDLTTLASSFISTYSEPTSNNIFTINLIETGNAEVIKLKLDNLIHFKGLYLLSGEATTLGTLAKAVSFDTVIKLLVETKGLELIVINDDQDPTNWQLIFIKTTLPAFDKHLPVAKEIWSAFSTNDTVAMKALLTAKNIEELKLFQEAIQAYIPQLTNMLEVGKENTQAKEILKWWDRTSLLQGALLNN